MAVYSIWESQFRRARMASGDRVLDEAAQTATSGVIHDVAGHRVGIAARPQHVKFLPERTGVPGTDRGGPEHVQGAALV